MNFSETYNHQAMADLEATILEKTGLSLSKTPPRYEYFDFPPSRGFWLKAPLRLRFVLTKPALTPEEYRQIIQVYHSWREDQRKAGDKGLVLSTRPIEDTMRYYRELEKKNGGRTPLLQQLKDRRKHPILARIFGFFWNLSYKLAPPWGHFELIITRKSRKEKGSAA